jgi:D-proline reductase (dithiol) PrdB
LNKPQLTVTEQNRYDPGNYCATMASMVDSYRLLDGVAKRVMQHWSSLRAATPTPWTPLDMPLPQCTIALVSAAALALNSDPSFDVQIERLDPWFSDPSYRVLPCNTRTGEAQSFHLHINPAFATQDLNCVMPLERLAELVAMGEVGESAPSHYSYIGYTLRPERLLRETVPSVVERMRKECVDAVVLIPASPVCCWSVGLVQCEMEAAGFSTISLSMIPEPTASTGAPRIAAVEHPFGLTLGSPGDVGGQLAVLRATLKALGTKPDSNCPFRDETQILDFFCFWFQKLFDAPN